MVLNAGNLIPKETFSNQTLSHQKNIVSQCQNQTEHIISPGRAEGGGNNNNNNTKALLVVGELLESSGWRPGMLLNILQCTGQIPTTKNYSAPNINSPEVEKP